MHHNTVRRAAVSSGLTALVLSVTGCSFMTSGGGPDDAGEAVVTARTGSGAVVTDEGIAAEGTTLEFQTGSVIEASGSLQGVDVSVSVVDNSIHGSTVTVALGGNAPKGFGYVERPEPYVVDGRLRAVVTVNGSPFRVTGRLAPDGGGQQVSERIQDPAGQPVRTRGTNTPLAGRVVVRHEGERAVLHLDRAYAYDVEVHRG